MRVEAAAMRRRALLVTLPLTVAGPAFAAEQPVALRPGPGLEVVERSCALCHSLDYIPMNSPFLSAAGWAAEVAKMRGLFGAPLGEADAATIRAYLAAAYGTRER